MVHKRLKEDSEEEKGDHIYDLEQITRRSFPISRDNYIINFKKTRDVVKERLEMLVSFSHSMTQKQDKFVKEYNSALSKENESTQTKSFPKFNFNIDHSMDETKYSKDTVMNQQNSVPKFHTVDIKTERSNKTRKSISS